MEFTKKIPPRIFYPTNDGEPIADHGKIFLEADEQITFVTKEGEEYDFAAKDWGFYATPSINKRLTDEGFRTALVRNSGGKYYVMVVRVQSLGQFDGYLKRESCDIIEWLDER